MFEFFKGISRLRKSWTVSVLILLCLGGVARSEWSLDSSKAHYGTGVTYVEKKITNAREGGDRLVHLVLVNSRQCTLRVVDNPAGKLSLASAMEGNNCLAGVNGGYFRSDFSPIGLVIGNGRQIHSLEHGKLISGVVVVSKGRVALLRIGEFKPAPSITEALQSGPFLIDRGRPVQGLNASKRADRTVVISDGKGGFGLLMVESVSLAEMAQILANPQIFPELKISRALNLDGGSSSGIWMREPPVYQRELKTVRDFLSVIARK